MRRTSRTRRGPITAALAILVACDRGTDPPVPASLEFDTQPGTTVAGTAIGPVRVRVLDASGNVFTGAMSVTVGLGNGNGAALLGTRSVTTANGVATFSDLRIEKAGTGYILNASAGSLAGATSNPFDVTHAAAAKLRFIDQPTQALAGQPFSPPVTIEITDQYGNRAASARNAVTIQLAGQPAGTMMGTTTVEAVVGIATFNSIAVARAGSYSLTASAGGLSPATSATFTVGLAPRARFCPPDALTGTSFASFTDAIEATESGGTIVICDGTHGVTVTMDTPRTIVAEHAHAATLTPSGSDSHIIWVREGGPGTYAFRDLNFLLPGNGGALTFGTAPFNPPIGRYDQVLIENNRFLITSPPGLGVGVGVSSSSIPTAKVIVRGNMFTGGSIGVSADHAGSLEITSNEFRDQIPAPFLHNASIQLWNGGPYVVRNNVVKGCPGRCIQSWASDTEISANTVETSVAAPTQVGIETIRGRVAVSRNVIRGVGAVADRADVNSYAFKWAGILAQLAAEAVSVNGNSIVNARSGIWVHASRVTGSDNTVSLVRWGLETTDAGPTNLPADPTFHRNDFTDYVEALFVQTPWRDGFASCNYWGSPAGPPTGNPAWFTPFSSVPIANRPEVKCP